MMEKRNIRQAFLRVGALLLGALCLVGLWLERGNLYQPFAPFTASDISEVVADANGNTYLICGSGYRVAKIDSNGSAVLTLKGQSTKENRFYKAVQVVADRDGALYLHNLEPAEDAYAYYGGESILHYNAEGKLAEVLTSQTFSKAQTRQSIINMQLWKDELYWFTADNDSVSVTGRNGETVAKVPLDDARRMALYVQWDGASVIVLTYSGQVRRITLEGATEVLYDGAGTDSVPWRMCLSDDGTLYMTDVGKRTVEVLQNGAWQTYYQGEGEQNERYAQITVSVGSGFVSNNSDYIVTETADGVFESQNSFPLSNGLVLHGVLAWAALLGSIVFLLTLLVLLVRFLLRQGSTVRICAGIFCGALILGGLLCGIMATRITSLMVESMLEQEQMVAEMLQNTIPMDSLSALDDVGDYRSEDYEAVRAGVRNVLLNSDGEPNNLYCVLYTVNSGVEIGRYSTYETTGACYPYDYFTAQMSGQGYVGTYEGSDDEYLYTTGKQIVYKNVTTAEGSYLMVCTPLVNQHGVVVGFSEVGTDLTGLQKTMYQIIFELLATAAVMVIVLELIALELVIFVQAIKGRTVRSNGKKQIPVDLLRSIVFLIFFLTNLSTSFLSVYALKLAEDLANPEFWAAVPISAEVVTGALASLWGATVIRKLGQHRAAILGGVLFVLGLSIRCIATSLVTLTLGNAISGCGWGVVLLIVSAEIAQRDEQEKESGFSGYSGALQNGVNSGIVFGGFLVQWIHYQGVLLCAAAGSVLVLLLSAQLLLNGEDRQEQRVTASSGTLRFLLRPKVLLYLMCFAFPVVASGYYLTYLYPIVGVGAGISEMWVGYSYLLNGMMVIAFGQILTKRLNRVFPKPVIMLFMMGLNGLTFCLVAWQQTVPILLVALILLGIAGAFGFPTASLYYTELPETKAYGYDRAMGLYNLFENGAQAAGSFLFAAVLTAGLQFGLTVFAIVLIVLSLIFCIGSLVGRGKSITQKTEA